MADRSGFTNKEAHKFIQDQGKANLNTNLHASSKFNELSLMLKFYNFTFKNEV